MRKSQVRKTRHSDSPAGIVDADILQGDVFLNVAEVCRLLRVPAATVYQLTHRGRIPHFKIASRLRFRRSEILDWIEERRGRGGGRIERPKSKNPLDAP